MGLRLAACAGFGLDWDQPCAGTGPGPLPLPGTCGEIVRNFTRQMLNTAFT